MRNNHPPEPMKNPSKEWVQLYESWYNAPDDTPSSKWHDEQKEDPHGGRYDCKRVDLFGGQFTDDEMANWQFLAEGQIIKQTAVKDRIRWLSRQLEKANAEIEKLKKKPD